jgi:general secretion pathway protein K
MRRKQHGYMMVQVIVVVACLVALMGMLLANQRAILSEMYDRNHQRRAESVARSGIAYALSLLQNANTSLVNPTDDWVTFGQNGQEELLLGDDSFRIQIVDNGSLINLNTATEEQLQQLPLQPEQIDSLLDWREAGQTPRPNGAKDDYYHTLQYPYDAKLANLTTLSELLLVRGWTARMLYTTEEEITSSQVQPQDSFGNALPLAGMFTVNSGSPTTRADGSARVNLAQGVNANTLNQLGVRNQQVVAQLVARAPYTSFRALLGVPGLNAETVKTLLDGATFSAGTRQTGKINLNTASEQVIRSLPNIPSDVASAIVSRQSSGFQSLGDLSTIPGLNTDALAQVADSFTVGSDTWTIRVYGQSGNVGLALEITVRLLNSGRIQIQNWNRLNVSGIPAWWGWQPNTTTTTQLGVIG